MNRNKGNKQQADGSFLCQITGIAIFVIVGLFSTLSQAAGLLTPINQSLPAPEIKSHDVDVLIENGYAITTVEQVFHNPGQVDTEAVYSFPVPEQAAVSEFTVWIDGKPVSGEVLEKKRARQLYEAEKQAGRDAGLTEKDEYRTFDISVSPVRAQQDTRIRLSYIQSVHIDTGIGRYVYPLEEGGVDEQKLAFWTANEKVKEDFSFNIKLKSGCPVNALRLPDTPSAVINQHGPGEWQATLQYGQANVEEAGQPIQVNSTTTSHVYELDRDIVVYWRMQQDLPGSVDMVTYKPEGSNRGTFMMTLTPGDDLKPVTEGSDWIFVLDQSGSMKGKYATLADGVQRSLSKMRANDRFRIILFNNSSSELTSGYVPATAENVRYYAEKVATVSVGGGTNLHEGIRNSLSSIDADRTSAIILVTDGVANVGETEQRKFIDLLKDKDIRLFTFIMGNSANRPLLESLVQVSNGFAVSVSNSDDIVGKILEATSKVTHESLHGVELEIDGVKTADISPAKIGSLYRGQQLVMFGHYWGSGIADVRLKGNVSGEQKLYQTQIKFPTADAMNPELERLWAYSMVEDAMNEINMFGENADIRNSIVDIGTEYGLVTDYTSMIVVREEVFQANGIKRTNAKRLKREADAKQARSTQSVTNNRVDTQKPMFSSKRANYGSGGGAVNPLMLLLLIPAMLLRKRIRS